MHLTYLVTAAMAATSVGFIPDSLADPDPARSEIEVVYTDASAAFACDGCKSSYTDSMEAGDSYTCPNGDKWSFTVGTPTVRNAICVPLGYICSFSGSCVFARSGTLTFTGDSTGDCAIYYRVDDDLVYKNGSNNLTLSLDSSVACRAGWPGEEDCEYRTIEFYDSTSDGTNVVVMSWDVNFCCSRCPD